MSDATDTSVTRASEDASASSNVPSGTPGADDLPRVVVLGGGITGLVAAHRLLGQASVTVVEASGRLGGQVQSVMVDGVAVDVGAEAIHLGAPAASALVRELGLDKEVVGARPGTSLLLTRKGLRPLPAGVGPTGPTQVGPVLKSGILSPAGLVRAGLEPMMRRRIADDIAVADFVQLRFGREVAETFVDPLLGNLHSGNVHALSLHSTAAQLTPVAASGESLLVRALRNGRRSRASAGGPGARPTSATISPLPMFASWAGGVGALSTALADRLAAAADVRMETRAVAVERGAEEWLVHTDAGVLAADHVVVALPASGTADVLGVTAPAVAVAMQWVRTASVATVVLAYDRADAARSKVLRDANGLLLTSRQSGVMKAMTNMSRKWPTLDAAEHHIIRVSVGRSTTELALDLSDEAMVGAIVAELRHITGLQAVPQFSQVVRYPHTMPQLGVGHGQRVAGAREQLAELALPCGRVHLAGAPIDGLGLASTIKSGEAAAAAIVSSLG